MKKMINSKKLFAGCNREFSEAGWTIKFKTARDRNGNGDGFYYLWISNKGISNKSRRSNIKLLN